MRVITGPVCSCGKCGVRAAFSKRLVGISEAAVEISKEPVGRLWETRSLRSVFQAQRQAFHRNRQTRQIPGAACGSMRVPTAGCVRLSLMVSG